MFSYAKRRPVDKYLAMLLGILVIGGFIIFNSASLGLLAKNGEQFSSVAFSQTFFGLFLGTVACIVFSRIDYHVFKKLAWPILIAGTAMTLLVFVPDLGFAHGGATRWISIGSFTFQPSEFMKPIFILTLARFLGNSQRQSNNMTGLIIALALTGLPVILLLKQL